jgi:hypothetical protein
MAQPILETFMVSLVGLLVVGLGVAVAGASLRTRADAARLERWGAVLFLAGAVIAGAGCPLV